MKRLAAFALLAVGLAGCFARQEVIARAAADLKCSSEQITTPTNTVQIQAAHAVGCGRENWYFWDGVGWVSPLDRGSFELSCPKDKLTVSALGDDTLGVTGCGRRATYILLAGRHGERKLVLNSKSEGDGDGERKDTAAK